MQILYTQDDGSKLVYEREDKEIVYGYVIRPDGKQYPTMPIESILARGYWEVAEEVLKHGEHDQSSHGNWAKGNFDEEALGEDAQSLYFDTYGIKTDGSKDPVGITRDEIRSLDDYTGDGFKKINSFLRKKGDVGTGSLMDIEKKVSDIDKVIEESPDLFGDKNLYRIFANGVLDDLREGDILTDRAFLSTTRVDITNPKNIDTLQNLQMISEADDRTAIILPSPSRSGKGLAVDYMKNAVSDLFANTSTANNEKEVILPRNTPLKLIGYRVVNEGTDSNMVIAVLQRVDK
jgi:hypothetical protein